VARGGLETAVLDVPIEVDAQVAELKLASMGRTIDELTPEQSAYLASYDIGT
jgi:adenosylhomocysteinase